MIIVRQAPAYLTVQDMGRRGHLASGVPRGGAMDRWTLASLNCMIGNDRGAAGLEWALSGGTLEFRDTATIAVGGADASCSLGETAIEPYRSVIAKAGQTLDVERIMGGRFLYIAVSGGIACDVVLGSRSTYVAGGFGGVEGRRFKSADTLETGISRRRRRRHQVSDPLPQHLRPPEPTDAIRVVTRSFDAGDIPSELENTPYVVSTSSDRTGYRLDGPRSANGGSVASEPACPGTIQLPPGGQPIVLMADAPTIGGYRILGSVISADIGSLAQRSPGDAVQFQAITVRAAQEELRRCEETLLAIGDWAS